MRYVVVDIGCIECGEPSNLLGLFSDLEDASALMRQASAQQEADWRGEHHFVVWDVDSKEEVDFA